jgi:hypothetical protein
MHIKAQIWNPKMKKINLAVTVSLLMLSACATAPINTKKGIETAQELSDKTKGRNSSIKQFVDRTRLSSIESLGLPKVTVADGIVSTKITQAQADLVVNRAGRDACRQLANYFDIRRDEDKPDLNLQFVVTAINPTNSAASGVSALLGAAVPGPFRLPAGLGGFAADGSANNADGNQIVITKWAKGANAFTNDAKVSTIGDAYQLAGSFGMFFAKLLISPDGKKSKARIALDKTRIDKSRVLCDARFGKASVAGRGASLLLPLSPEAIDAGAPANQVSIAPTEVVPTAQQ